MNGDRTHLPEGLAAALGALAAVAGTVAVHHQDAVAQSTWGNLDAGTSWWTETVIATDLVAPSVVAVLALLLLLRAGHRGLAVASAVAWIVAEAALAVVRPGLWALLMGGLDVDDGFQPAVVASVALGCLVVVGAPIQLARRTIALPDRRPPGGRRAAALGVGAGLAALVWTASGGDDTLLDDQRWLLLVGCGVVGAALAAGLPRQRPDVVTLATLAGVVGAWRLVVLGLGRVDGLGSWHDDAARAAALLVAGVLSAVLGQVVTAGRGVTARGPVLWGHPSPFGPGVHPQHDPAPGHGTARLSLSAVAAVTAVTVAAVGVVGWQAHRRSPGVTRATLASARAVALHLGEDLLPARADLTGTACGEGLWTWCGTTADGPRTAAGKAADAMARHGWHLDDVTCSTDDHEMYAAARPLSTLAWAPVCTARARRGDVTIAVAAGDTVGWLGRAGYPAFHQGRTSVMVGAWAAHDDDLMDARATTPDGGDGTRVIDVSGWAPSIAPHGWTSVMTCTSSTSPGEDDPAPRNGPCPAGDSVHLTLSQGADSTSEDTPGTFAAIGRSLRQAGFVVGVAGCAPSGRCQVLATRWAGAYRTEPETVVAKQRADGSILLLVSP